MAGKKKLEGKIAIVTGASKGIGAAIALHLAEEGANIVVNYATSKKDAETVVKKIKSKGGDAIAVQADMSNPKDVQKLFSEAKKKYKKLDILINNAGVYEFIPLEEITPEKYHRMFNINVLGLIMASKEAVKNFGAKGGSIINISSIASTRALPTGSVYCGTKAAVDAVTRCLSLELGPRKIRVNSINPGMVVTEGTKSMGIIASDFEKNTVEETALGRIGQPNDIAPAAVFLSSDDASWITGRTFYIDGGLR